VSLEGAAGGSRVLDDISLTIHAGEIVGIAGVEGNGQAELVEVVMGMREPTSGTITLGDVDISEWDVREIREAGVGFIPEDRHRHGMLLEAPLWENVILGHQTRKPNVGAGGLINAKAARAETERIVKDYDVRTPSIYVTGGSLSGGNQQKLIIGREMSRGPRAPAHLRRPRGAGGAVRHDLGDAPRLPERSLRPGHGDPRGARRGDDRSQRAESPVRGRGGRQARRRARAGPAAYRRREGRPTMRRLDLRRVGLGLAAPLLAILVAFIVTSLILLIAGDPVGAVWAQLIDVPLPRQVVAIINAATVYYISAIAVAVGFRMNLFNIGVDGQYRVAAFAAAVFAGQAWLPGPLNIAVSLLVAMAAGGLWAGIAGILKVTRGVSEVISTIMLNAIATFLVSFLLSKAALRVEGSNAVNTRPIPESSRVPGISVDGIIATPNLIYGFIVLAVVVGLAYWFVLGKTRFGFDLRTTGRSETAAVASGVKVKRMVLTSMVISGAAAGLVGMPLLFGQDYTYGDTFQAGLGFAGIAIALLGRNNAVGIVFAALLWAYLDAQGNGLQINAGVSDRLVLVIQGVIVLSVVIAYEIVRRAGVRMEQRRVAAQLAAATTPSPEKEGATA